MKSTDKWRDLGDVGGVGIQFVLSIALGYYVGRWVDARWFHARGWATGIGAFFGIAAAFKAIYDAAKRSQLRLEQLDREEAEARAERIAQRQHEERRG